jgi:hypothetical protein
MPASCSEGSVVKVMEKRSFWRPVKRKRPLCTVSGCDKRVFWPSGRPRPTKLCQGHLLKLCDERRLDIW